MLLTLSIVSHGHGDKVKLLICDLNRHIDALLKIQIVLTLNAPELESTSAEELSTLSHWPIQILKNMHAKGFAENHNAAFENAEPGIWGVVNPDIGLPVVSFHELALALLEKDTGIAFPRQTSVVGDELDYRRKLVTPWSLMKRHLGRRQESPAQPDWVSGCFMAFRSEVYQELGGFDEKYFLYCEDVDICLRLQLAGYKMAEADFSVIHDTRRGTLKKWEHFKWHVSSLLKLWCSRAFWAYLWNRNKIRQRQA